MARFWGTLIALAQPRRAVPIAAVFAALVGAQVYYGGWRTAVVPFAMMIAFLALAPWSWRALLANRRSWQRTAAFAAQALAVVAACGIALPRALDLGLTFLTDGGSLAIAGVLYVVGGWGLGRDIELELDLEHVRLAALRAHLDPHFLYNTLNAIAEWCADDPRVAEEATVRLADILRAILEAFEQRSWPLARELAIVDDFLALHRIRDPGAFTADVELEPAAAAIEVPPLLALALVENAVKHGPRAGHRGAIAIRVRRTGDGVRCEVENPGAYAPDGGGGRGLATLRRRLALAYGRRARFSIAASGDRTRAVLELGRRSA